eukprot:COSAG02_NODE_27_length_51735_cov_86.076749_4_plen_141_part_00
MAANLQYRRRSVTGIRPGGHHSHIPASDAQHTSSPGGATEEPHGVCVLVVVVVGWGGGGAAPLATMDTQRGLARGVVAHRPVMQMAVLRRDGEPEVVHKPHRGLRPARHTSRRHRSAQPHCFTPLTLTARCMVPTTSYKP